MAKPGRRRRFGPTASLKVSRILPVSDSSQSGTARSVPARSAITVVIPTYNRVEILPQTLSTVFAQAPRPAEVIVVDDGSTDGTSEYLDSVDVSQVSNPGGGWGPARARNEGFRRTTSDLIAFLDSDDLMLPNSLSQLESALNAAKTAPFAFGRSLIARKEADQWHPAGLMTAEKTDMADPLPSLFARNFVPSVGSLARVDAVRRIGGYPSTTNWATEYSEDHYFWVLLAQLGDPVFVPELTSVYREHAGNRHSPAGEEHELNKYLALADGDPRLIPVISAHLGVVLCNSFTHAISAGNRAAAAEAVRRSLLTRRDKFMILRHAFRHWRDRRKWVRAGMRTWREDDDLRAWLEQY